MEGIRQINKFQYSLRDDKYMVSAQRPGGNGFDPRRESVLMIFQKTQHDWFYQETDSEAF